jgi:Copper transport outer membrane protein, MctB
VISLRQHIFSLVAVFVALAIGIAAGSTVVRGPLLDSLRARVESAEQLIEVERTENDALAAELAQLDDWVVDGPAQLLGGRLPDSAVVLVVAGGVDADVVAGLLRSIRATSAALLGEIRIDDAVFDPAESERVRAALGMAASDETDPAAAFGRRVAELMAPLAEAVVSTPGVVGAQAIRGAFGDLEDGGLVDLLDIGGGEIVASAFEVLVVTDRNLTFDPTALLDGVITMSDPEGAALTVLVAEVGRVDQDNENPTPSYVQAIRASGRLRDEVSTVDNAETVLGWVAGVLGLEAAGDGAVAHYGFRAGADRAIPPRSS